MSDSPSKDASRASDKSFFDIMPVPSERPSWSGYQPDRLVVLSLRKGKGDAVDIVYGDKARVFRNFDFDDVENLAASPRIGDGWETIRPGRRVPGRSPTTLSLAAKGSFILALQLEGKLKQHAIFHDRPFGIPRASDGWFAWSTRLATDPTIAFMAVRAPVNDMPLAFNINLLVSGGAGSGDNNPAQDHYRGMDCLTPIIIDPDIRWPDGMDVPGLPPPPQ